jgi:hypothetical protein
MQQSEITRIALRFIQSTVLIVSTRGYVDVFSRDHAVIAQDSFGHHVGGGAEIADTDRFVSKVRHFLNLRLGEKIRNPDSLEST